MERLNLQTILVFLIGLIFGLIIYGNFVKNESDPEIITKIETVTDTVHVTKIDTIFITKKEIVHKYLRDTIINEYKPKIRLFTASKPYYNGSVFVSGEVLGEVLKIDIRNNIKMPVVTNTITKTNTVVKNPAGIYATVGIENNTPNVGAIYVRKNWMVGVNTSGFSVGVRVR